MMTLIRKIKQKFCRHEPCGMHSTTFNPCGKTIVSAYCKKCGKKVEWIWDGNGLVLRKMDGDK